MIILFPCLVGWLDSSPIEIFFFKLRHNLPKTAWAYSWGGIMAGVNTGMCMQVYVRVRL